MLREESSIVYVNNVGLIKNIREERDRIESKCSKQNQVSRLSLQRGIFTGGRKNRRLKSNPECTSERKVALPPHL